MPTIIQRVEAVRHLEREIKQRQKEICRSIRKTRNRKHLPLAAIASEVGMSRASIHNIERCKSWNTDTVAKVAEVLESLAA